MALRAVPDHPKFADFKRRLSLTKGSALGYLEAIWHFAGRFTPSGNIGKYQDSAIEAWVEWDGEPGALIEALVQSQWAHHHENPELRIVIHDWSAHADEIVNTVLSRQCALFWDGTVPKSGRLNKMERERYHQWIDELGKQPRESHRPKLHQPEGSRKAAETTKPAPAPAPAPANRDVTVIRPLSKNRNEVGETNEKRQRTNGHGSGNGNGHHPVSSHPSSSSPDCDPRASRMEILLHAYMGMDGTDAARKYKKPDAGIIQRCLTAVGPQTDMDHVAQFLRDRFVNGEQSPRHRSGPNGYAWFEKVLLAQFGGNQ